MKKLLDDNYLYLLVILGLLGAHELPRRFDYLSRDQPTVQDAAIGETFGLLQTDLPLDHRLTPWMNKTALLQGPAFLNVSMNMRRNHLNFINTWLVTDGRGGGVVLPETPSAAPPHPAEQGSSSASLRSRSMAEIVFPGSDLSDEDMDLIDMLWNQDIDMGIGREAYDPLLKLEMERKVEQERQRKQQLHNIKTEDSSGPTQHQLHQLMGGTSTSGPESMAAHTATPAPPDPTQNQWVPKIDPETGEYLLSGDFATTQQEVAAKSGSAALMSPLQQQMGPAQPQQPFVNTTPSPPQPMVTGRQGPITPLAMQQAFQQVQSELGVTNVTNQQQRQLANVSTDPMLANRSVAMQPSQERLLATAPRQSAIPAMLSQQSVEHALNHLYDENSTAPATHRPLPTNATDMFLGGVRGGNATNGMNLSAALIHNASFAAPSLSLAGPPAAVDNDTSLVPDNSELFGESVDSLMASEDDMRWCPAPVADSFEEPQPGTMGEFLHDLFQEPEANNVSRLGAPPAASGGANFTSVMDPETGELVSNRPSATAEPASMMWNDSTLEGLQSGASGSGSDLFDSASFYEGSPNWAATSYGMVNSTSDISRMNGSSTASGGSSECEYNETSDYGGSGSGVVGRDLRPLGAYAEYRPQHLRQSGPMTGVQGRHFPGGAMGRLDAAGVVRHNHTYTAPPGGVPHVRKMDMKQEKSQKGGTRDERRLLELGIPLTVSQIVGSAVEEFNDVLRLHDLTPIQLQTVRDIRRRGKNKVAAQNCRRRRLGAVLDIGERVSNLQSERDQAEEEYSDVVRQLSESKSHLARMTNEVFATLRDENGRPYDRREYALEIMPDGNAVLVKRKEPVAMRDFS